MSYQDTIYNQSLPNSEVPNWHYGSSIQDSCNTSQSWSLSDSIQESFLQSTSVDLNPLIRLTNPYGWMVNAVLVLLIVMVFLWFFVPNQVGFSHRLKQIFQRPNESSNSEIGFFFSFFFFLNYMFVMVLFLILTVDEYVIPTNLSVSPNELIKYIAIAFVSYGLYKMVFISLIGYIFKTIPASVRQVQMYVNVDNLTGFVMLAILLLILFIDESWLYYLGFFVLLVAFIIKWVRTISIGKTIFHYQLYHLIFYLCTLEIIPLLLLIRLVKDISI